MLRTARLQSCRHSRRVCATSESSRIAVPIGLLSPHPASYRSNSSASAGRHGLSFGPLRSAPTPSESTSAESSASNQQSSRREAFASQFSPRTETSRRQTDRRFRDGSSSRASQGEPSRFSAATSSRQKNGNRHGDGESADRFQSRSDVFSSPSGQQTRREAYVPSPLQQSSTSSDAESQSGCFSFRVPSVSQAASGSRSDERSGISFGSQRSPSQQQADSSDRRREERSGISFGALRPRTQQLQASQSNGNTRGDEPPAFNFGSPRNAAQNGGRDERSGLSFGPRRTPRRDTQGQRWDFGGDGKSKRPFDSSESRDRSSATGSGRWMAEPTDRRAAESRQDNTYGVKHRQPEWAPRGRSVPRWTESEETENNRSVQNRPSEEKQRRKAEEPQRTPPSAKNWRVPDERVSKKDVQRSRDAERSEYEAKPRPGARRRETEVDRRLREIARAPKEVFLPEVISVNNLARLVGVKPRSLQTKMMHLGMTDTRPAALLRFDDSAMLCAEYNLNAVSNDEAAFDIYPAVPPTAEEKSTLPLRPPVVTVMGHVDHGKTSLLDRLRSASVAAGEAGGITQHIGAFSVPVKAASGSDANSVNKITFLDTPGHAAFSNMRARGAKATDIVVLVVAADDGVMAQTKEVIKLYHALDAEARASAEAEADESGNASAAAPVRKKNNIQLMVALSKCDRPAADPRRAKEQLAAEGIFVEDMSGDVPCVEISSKTGQGFDALEETLAVMAELGDLRSPVAGLPEGIVLESRTEKGLGNTATVLVTRGTLTAGNFLIAGHSWAKVRGMVDSNRKSVKQAKAGEAVLVSGWKDLPVAGEEVLSAAKEDAVKKAVENRKETETRRQMVHEAEAINEVRRKKREEDDRLAQEDYLERERRRQIRMADEAGETDAAIAESAASTQEGSESDGPEIREVRLIVKSDFSGTGEALEGAVSGLVLNCPGHSARVKILSLGVGDLSESDLSMARAGAGHHTALVGFNVKAPRNIAQEAKTHNISIFTSAIIYEIIDYVKDALSQVLPRQIETRVAGEATIAQIFSIAAGKGQSLKVAGVRVTNGVISRANVVRVLRPIKGSDEGEMETIFEGRLSSIKQVKKEVQEMRKGTECGLSFDGFDGFQEGDVVHCVEQSEVVVPFR